MDRRVLLHSTTSDNRVVSLHALLIVLMTVHTSLISFLHTFRKHSLIFCIRFMHEPPGPTTWRENRKSSPWDLGDESQHKVPLGQAWQRSGWQQFTIYRYISAKYPFGAISASVRCGPSEPSILRVLTAATVQLSSVKHLPNQLKQSTMVICSHWVANSELLTSSFAISPHILTVNDTCRMKRQFMPICLLHIVHVWWTQTGSSTQSRPWFFTIYHLEAYLMKTPRTFSAIPSRTNLTKNGEMRYSCQTPLAVLNRMIVYRIPLYNQKFPSTMLAVGSGTSTTNASHEQHWIALFGRLA